MKLAFFSAFFIFGLLLSVYCIQAMDPSLVLYLPLDENDGKIAADFSDYKNDAALKGNPKWVPGKFNSGIEVNTGNYLEVKDSDSLDLTDAMTISCWVKILGLTADHQSGVEKGASWSAGEYNLLPVYSGGVLLQMNDLPDGCDDETIGGPVSDGGWYFITGTWDGKTITIYINGEESRKLPCEGKLEKNADSLFIGCRGGSGRWMVGILDEIKVYNRALTVEEIRDDMENPGRNLAVNAAGRLAVTWGSLKERH